MVGPKLKTTRNVAASILALVAAPAWALTPAQALALQPQASLPPAWAVVAGAFVLFITLIWILGHYVHPNAAVQRQMRQEASDTTVISGPDEAPHHFHH